MSQRQPLTAEERAELARRYFEEDDRSIKVFECRAAGSLRWVIAYPMGEPSFEHSKDGELINPGGAVWLPGHEEGDGHTLTISEARDLAALLMAAADHEASDLARVLLQAADHAEFGPLRPTGSDV